MLAMQYSYSTAIATATTIVSSCRLMHSCNPPFMLYVGTKNSQPGLGASYIAIARQCMDKILLKNLATTLASPSLKQ